MMGFQVVLVVKNLPANAGDAGDVGLIPGLGRSSGGGHGTPPQYSCLESPLDKGVWWATVHRFEKRELDMTERLILAKMMIGHRTIDFVGSNKQWMWIKLILIFPVII